MFNHAAIALVLGASLSACQTLSVVPEETRLSLLMSNPVDYSRFPERQEADYQEGRGLNNSLQLAEVIEKNESSLYVDEVIQENLKERLLEILPKDYVYKMGDEELTEYPLGTEIHLSDNRFYNAHALKNGDLLFSLGFLTEVNTEDRLEWVIAHEAAHQLLDHHKAKEDREARNQAISILGSVAILALGDSNAANIALGATTGALVLNNAGAAQFDAKEEIQADQLAMDLILAKETPRNPREGVNQLIQFLDGRQVIYNEQLNLANQEEQKYRAYCGDAGLFNFKTRLENPNAQTRVCQSWYVVGRSGVERLVHLPEAKKQLDIYQARLDASKEYYSSFIQELPIISSTKFYDEDTNAETDYATSINKYGPTVRKATILKVNDLLAAGNCSEAIREVKESFRGPNDNDSTIREVAFKTEQQCDAPVRLHGMKAVCKPSYGDFGAYEHLCAAYQADNPINEGMMSRLQGAYASRGLYDDALKILYKRRAKSGNYNKWYPELIRLLLQSGNAPAAEEEYQNCAELSEEGYPQAFIEQCDRAAHPEKYAVPETPAVGTGAPAQGGADVLEPLEISFAPNTTFDVFEEALLRTELSDMVQGSGEFVVYMPSDSAIRRYLGGEDPRNILEPRRRQELRNMVAAHIVRKDETGSKHLSSPHLKAGFDPTDDVETLLNKAGGIVTGSATMGPVTIKPVDTVIDPAKLQNR